MTCRFWLLVSLLVIGALLMPLTALATDGPTVPKGACADTGLMGYVASRLGTTEVWDGSTWGMSPYSRQFYIVVDPALRQREITFRSYSRDLRTASYTPGGRLTTFGDGSFEIRWPAMGNNQFLFIDLYARNNEVPAASWHRITARAVGSRCTAQMSLQVVALP